MLLQGVSPLLMEKKKKQQQQRKPGKRRRHGSGLPLPSHHAASCILHRINIDQISCNPGLIDKANFR
ncbi:hypothetical protein TRV_01950 [Trichophyton verrucosum HKI 0517]|uniref:Uncharacterized protein n=1 Tax=Trichophyton verrucosum (strain HKI 0517) TaxID=663202 RepID=D4D4D5_TRIVH|nr:uncharacterized protein TRV_01950 [Trichophyton verrucosum HKI 0517]EFE43282.1 hypothetical protein TRV_01950 [Trichophyton verrucosum HKI 0517]